MGGSQNEVHIRAPASKKRNLICDLSERDTGYISGKFSTAFILTCPVVYDDHLGRGHVWSLLPRTSIVGDGQDRS